MTPDEVRNLIREEIRQELASLIRSDRFTFEKLIQMLDGRNIQVGRTTGTKIGTATDQKLSVFGVTPVIQASAISAPTAPGVAYLQAEAASAVTAINSIRTAIKNFGITA